MIPRVLIVIVALWVGSLITICGLVAPSLFAVLSDRHVAGDLAGHFFRVASWLGLACGGVAMILLARAGGATKTRSNYALLVATLAAPLLSEIVLHPLMDKARDAANMQLFGALHGCSALLFGIACVTGLGLLWNLSRQAG